MRFTAKIPDNDRRPERGASDGRGRARVGHACACRGQLSAGACGLWALLAIMLVDAPSASAYVTLGDLEGLGGAVVWTDTATVYLDGDSVPTGQRDLFRTELAAAVRVWSSVDCGRPGLAFGGLATDRGPVTVRWVGDWSSIGAAADAAGTTDIVLETSSDGVPRIVEATIYVNGGLTWAVHPSGAGGTARDIRAVLVHELGHVLGLAHVCELDDARRTCGEHDVSATMYPTYQGPGQAVLSSDDVEGICVLYPVVETPPEVGGECETSIDCPPGEACYGHDCWQDTAYGLTCEAGSDCPGLLCVETSTGGLCTHDCDSPADCPSGATCVMTMDERGSVCAPSAEYSGGCSAVHSRGKPLAGIPFLAALFISWRRRNA